jgi:hypothetical protein
MKHARTSTVDQPRPLAEQKELLPQMARLRILEMALDGLHDRAPVFGLTIDDADAINLASETIRGKLALLAECFPDTAGGVHFRPDVALGLKRVLIECSEDLKRLEQAMRRTTRVDGAR